MDLGVVANLTHDLFELKLLDFTDLNQVNLIKYQQFCEKLIEEFNKLRFLQHIFKNFFETLQFKQ